VASSPARKPVRVFEIPPASIVCLSFTGGKPRSFAPGRERQRKPCVIESGDLLLLSRSAAARAPVALTGWYTVTR
jgi:hypothetical protein